MKLNYKTISKNLTDFAKSDTYDKPAMLRIELTRFEAMHRAVRGRNGVGELVELTTRVIEADGVHIQPSDRSGLVTVYIHGATKGDHGFGSEGGTFLRIRDAKSKYHDVELIPTWERSETKVDALMRHVGEDVPARYAPEEFEAFKEEHKKSVVRLVKDASDDGEAKARVEAQLVREFAEKFYRDFVNYELDRREDSEATTKLLEFAGCKLVTFFNFTSRLRWFTPQYVEQTKQGVEFGWYDTGTYNSLPCTLSIRKVRQIKTVKLSDLGIEGPGYYDHTDRMRVLPEQVRRSRKFAARFRSKKRNVVEKVLSTVRKAG